MKPLNYTERKESIWQFVIVFFVMVSVMFIAGFLMLKTGEKGVAVLEEKNAKYSDMFRKKAEMVYNFEEIIRKLNQINNKERNLSQHKKFQDLISDDCDKIEQIIQEEENKEDFAIYTEMLTIVKDIQANTDTLKENDEKYQYIEELLERCKEKYLEEKEKKDKEGKKE